jgi:2,3-bisphosphoglycerate-independent phosphoglycerate mutase
VPLFVIDNYRKGVVKNGKLGDIAPSILTIMELPIPADMTGDVLV